ncbi:loricrin-like [Schistocerca americana]|uniref:loricrin-like n=1 Tax=Schistocerca americana TaxID=7009 RepID=UPI001F4F1DC4|nr:loricrin-like [Schistocerca americana]
MGCEDVGIEEFRIGVGKDECMQSSGWGCGRRGGAHRGIRRKGVGGGFLEKVGTHVFGGFWWGSDRGGTPGGISGGRGWGGVYDCSSRGVHSGQCSLPMRDVAKVGKENKDRPMRRWGQSGSSCSGGGGGMRRSG